MQSLLFTCQFCLRFSILPACKLSSKPVSQPPEQRILSTAVMSQASCFHFYTCTVLSLHNPVWKMPLRLFGIIVRKYDWQARSQKPKQAFRSGQPIPVPEICCPVFTPTQTKHASFNCWRSCSPVYYYILSIIACTFC